MLATDTRAAQGGGGPPNDHTYKAYDVSHPGVELLCGLAGWGDRCESVLAQFHFLCGSLGESRIEPIEHAWVSAYRHVWDQEASGEIMLQTGLKIEEWRNGCLTPERARVVQRIWAAKFPQVQAIVCGFAGRHGENPIAFRALNYDFPSEFGHSGYAAIGAGQDAADGLLASRGQSIHAGPEVSFYNLWCAMQAGAQHQSVSGYSRYAVIRQGENCERVDGQLLAAWVEHLEKLGAKPNSDGALQFLHRRLGLRF